MNRRALVAIVGVLAVVALFLVLRPSGEGGAPAPSPRYGSRRQYRRLWRLSRPGRAQLDTS